MYSHDWLRAIGPYREALRALPNYLRWSEEPIRWLLLCIMGLVIAHRMSVRNAIVELRFASPIRPALWFAGIALIPMLLAGLMWGRFSTDE